ncbi:MAG TPA: DegT/DnrJ/EryC1/StrS family aminotransferase [Pyrinomonadaceae bacterium]|jgi:perosamine synthetase
MERILISGPSITQKEIDYVTDAVTNAWYDKANLYHERFEKAFADYLGVRHAVSLPSCTSAIHLSLLALGVTSGDEVIVPDATWIASAAPINYVGATPVFADIDRRTWCLSGETIAACITPRTKAVIVVDLYGNMPEMDGVLKVAREHGLAVIEDAAEAAGAEYAGGRAGSFGDAGVFSFHGSKTLTTGEGGMLVTNDEALFRRALVLRDHGRKPGDKLFWNTEVAYKYKMSSMQAALGLAQLERIEELVERKREIFAWYREELEGIEEITLNQELPGARNVYWMVTVVLDRNYGIEKDALQQQLSDEGIDCRPFFHPLSSLPAYASLPQAHEAAARNRTSYEICPYGINLPSGLNLTREHVRYVCSKLKQILRQ